jgi:hypothetical protein
VSSPQQDKPTTSTRPYSGAQTSAPGKTQHTAGAGPGALTHPPGSTPTPGSPSLANPPPGPGQASQTRQSSHRAECPFRMTLSLILMIRSDAHTYRGVESVLHTFSRTRATAFFTLHVWPAFCTATQRGPSVALRSLLATWEGAEGPAWDSLARLRIARQARYVASFEGTRGLGVFFHGNSRDPGGSHCVV